MVQAHESDLDRTVSAHESCQTLWDSIASSLGGNGLLELVADRLATTLPGCIWRYQFCGHDGHDAWHANDLKFVSGDCDPADDTLCAVRRQWMASYASFATYGDPSKSGHLQRSWPPYCSKGQSGFVLRWDGICGPSADPQSGDSSLRHCTKALESLLLLEEQQEVILLPVACRSCQAAGPATSPGPGPGQRGPCVGNWYCSKCWADWECGNSEDCSECMCKLKAGTQPLGDGRKYCDECIAAWDAWTKRDSG
eukprot:gnl/TRDRNA2_/TRDRNA2_162241_c0_seq6.p1 gnl/TRDRNA2_/TRDRNA2_162241_c0~~gnl/TRDRNA2_/TRDRNA2_162241_c0_seq6.p1  ORF type:complete len:253 (+),score=29.24 gnl/TRDRNA2_/TRDRNA2_162241_c0_seq6:3-761(+)